MFEKVKEEHILKGIRDFIEKGIPKGFGPSSTYDLVYQDKKYPPKAIMAYANYHASGRKVERYFKGGQGTDCFKAFERNNFELKEKQMLSNSDRIKKEFAKYLLKYAPPSYKAYLGKSPYSAEKRLDEINSFFRDKDLFDVTAPTYKDIIDYISFKNQKSERVKNQEFFEYDRKHSRGIPIAILGSANYSKFLEGFDFERGVYGNDLEQLLQPYVSKYKQLIQNSETYNEVYKWEAVQNFQEHWDLASDDLVDMIDKSFPGNNNLWSSQNYYPINMLKEFIQLHPGKVKATLYALFKEDVDLGARVENYKTAMDDLLKENNRETGKEDKHHYQDGRTISMLLAFNAPSKHFLFKYSVLKSFCEKFKLDAPKKGDIVNQILINNEVSSLVKKILTKDEELLQIHEDRLTSSSFTRDDCNILTQDFMYSIINYLDNNTNYWLYAPGENASRWEEFYNEGIMALGWDNLGDLTKYGSKKEVVSALQEIHSTDSSKKNDATANFDFANEMKIGDLVFVKKGRSTLLGYGIVTSDCIYDENRLEFKNYREVEWKKKGTWDAGHNMVTKTLTDITAYDSPDTDYDTYYNRLMAIINNESISGINNHQMDLALNTILYGPPGTGKTFKLKEKYFQQFTLSETSLSKEQFIINLVSDLTWWQTFAIALYQMGTASVDQLLKHEIVKAKASLSKAKNIRPIAWSRMQAHTVPYCPNVNVSDSSEPPLFYKEKDSQWRVVKEDVEQLYPEGIEILEQIDNFRPSQDKMVKNYEFVTFHQSYGYEDFVEGIKPKLEDESTKLEYEITEGIFKKLCNRAEKDLDNNYAIFIDEINRGNVSAIFGELITLIEPDKRLGESQELKVKLPYSKTEFGVPPNLFIIGTMNTADRSVEALDTALRRRFVFEEVMPDPTLLSVIKFNGFNLEEVLDTINKRIAALLDRDHTIGHSYFIKLNSGDTAGLLKVFQNNIIPLLQEYFFNDYQKIALVLGPGFIEEKEPEKSLFPSFNGIDEPHLEATYQLIPSIEDIEEAVLACLGKSNE